ncbi:Protein fantastic four 3 [Apostasia shenzhenica]|uniref:Protein fantastic four 3 n=1 Tax=Apostasia shenzhenica TaxID=1088818 RepID=A0A2I0B509_9ASPA|nr:Protein fantastic four 3 [Apostasia shenzhenica]
MPSMLACHGLQSCLEPWLANPPLMKPRVHRWDRRVSSPTGPGSDFNKNRAFGLGRISQSSILNSAIQDHDPPPAAAGHENLELCTEILGCETGALCSVYELEPPAEGGGWPFSRKKSKTKFSALPEFPPPLTTLKGEGRLRLGRRRENGRLQLIPFRPSLLEAERSGGRLLVRLLPCKASSEEEEKEEVAAGDDQVDDDGREDIECLAYDGGDRYRRPAGCKEEEGGAQGRGRRNAAAVFNCDAFWVATS